uniref:Putative homing endonuclease n=1 Tax=viral metagenome TaxID=1070528 RepID=A0A6M3XEW1_9ZZZZ
MKTKYRNKISEGNNIFRDEKGRFIKGYHSHPETEFRKGEHWRIPKVYWKKEWLHNEYLTNKKSAGVIAKEQNCRPGNIIYFLKKFKINRRDKFQARNLRIDGLFGERNPMYGRRRDLCPSWKGGVTPLRQELYRDPKWKIVCQEVWIRDKRTCQRCDKKPKWNSYKDFHVHHIIPFFIKKYIFDLNNLILLCRKCHLWIHSKKNINRELIGGDESGIS